MFKRFKKVRLESYKRRWDFEPRRWDDFSDYAWMLIPVVVAGIITLRLLLE